MTYRNFENRRGVPAFLSRRPPQSSAAALRLSRSLMRNPRMSRILGSLITVAATTLGGGYVLGAPDADGSTDRGTAVAEEEGNQLAAGGDVEVAVERLDVVVDGVPAQAEAGGNLLLRLPFGERLEDLAGPGRE